MRAVRILLPVLLITLITLGLVEGALRLAAPALPGRIGVVARYITTGQPYTEAWTQAWRENRDHYYTLRPDITDALQYGSPSVSFRLTTHKLWDDGLPAGEGIGFRNPPVDYGVDAVVVGDSFAFCFTEDADCWVKLWAQRDGLGVVNLGTPVTGSLSHARMVADFAAPLAPPLVVWQWFGNDFYDDYVLHVWRGDIPPLTEPDAAPAEDSGASWLSRTSVTAAVAELLFTGTWSGFPESDRAYQAQYSVPYPGGVLEFGKAYERIALDMSTPQNQYGYDHTRAALIETQERVASWGGRLVVLMIPTREEVYADLTGPLMGDDALATLGSTRAAMHRLCADLALECLDPTDQLIERGRQAALYYPDDMHLNAAGNAALADILSAWLEDAP